MSVSSSSAEQQKRSLYDQTLFHTYLDRQIRIPDWNQDVISQQTCLVLGLGGLGSTVSIDLLRLGVKKMICVDYDHVETHNLNRQLLYNKSHVGQSKAHTAKIILEEQNICGTEIECHELDVIKHWDRIVEYARQCTVVFNMIDVGDYWDYAVQSLCLRLGLTFVSGGTFQTTVTVDYVHAKSRGACWSCMSDIKSDHLDRLSVDRIEQLKDLEFIPREEHPIGASTCYLAAMCAHLMVNRFVYGLQLSSSSLSSSTSNSTDQTNNEQQEQEQEQEQQELIDSLPNRIMFYLNTLEIDKWTLEKSSHCPLCCSLSVSTTTTSTASTANEQ